MIKHSPDIEVTVYRLGDRSSVPSIVSRPTLCIFQSPVRWILTDVYPGVKRLQLDAFDLFQSIGGFDGEWHFTST